jgi:CelD/BcsL family acetyltransferase involved in cellulose biosynthesis
MTVSLGDSTVLPALPEVSIRCVVDHEELTAYEKGWNALVERRRGALPFSSYAWVATFFEHRLQPGETWCCLVAQKAGDLVGVLPLVLGTMGPPLARLVHARTPGDDHMHAADMIVVDQEVSEAVVASLLRAAFEAIPGCFLVEFPSLSDDSLTLLVTGEGDWKERSIVSPAGRGAYVPIEGDFEDFREDLSGNMRSNLTKARNKLGALGQVEFEFRSPREVSGRDLADFLSVEASSWKGAAGSAILASESLVSYYTRLAGRLARAGWLEWQRLRAYDRTLAANLAVVIGRSTVIWKLGYDPEFARLSPGSLLLEEAIRRVHEQEPMVLREVNLVSDFPWYDNWQMRRREYHRLEIYAEGVTGRFLGYWPRRAKIMLRGLPRFADAARRARRILRCRP